MIKVRNIRTFTQDGSVSILVDRSSLLGNPFHMINESERDYVCDRYKQYFERRVHAGDRRFREELSRIAEIAKESDVTLLCWCYPKRCHAETIKKWLDDYLKEEKEK